MAHHYTTKPRSSGPTDIITYRYNGKLVYVPVAPNYIEALSHARDAFPRLRSLRDASISLYLTAPGHAQQFIGISAPAWPRLIAHLTQYQIIEVQVTQPNTHAIAIPDITITYADSEDAEEMEPVPPYRGSDVVDDEKASCPRPRSPSGSMLHPKRSWFFQKFNGHNER